MHASDTFCPDDIALTLHSGGFVTRRSVSLHRREREFRTKSFCAGFAGARPNGRKKSRCSEQRAAGEEDPAFFDFTRFVQIKCGLNVCRVIVGQTVLRIEKFSVTALVSCLARL